MEKIKVAIRTRPLIEREDGRSNWRIQNSNTIFQVNQQGKSMPNTFYSFDYIFDISASTVLLYSELVDPIVKSVVAGFNGTVFAYGQTSSGKTFTMMGTDELPGLIPFTFAGLFEQINQSTNCEFVLRLSYMEIYNESICDLLNPANTNLSIREGDDRIPYVANLTEAHITDFYSIHDYMMNGEQNRHTGSTRMNDHSSRSHTILRLILESKQFDEGSIKVSHLNLVDLAGSERASATCGDEVRFKEGTFINRSLLTLGTVIRRLSEGKQGIHIPYRDSKLTRILESSLGGNAKTVIICTVTTASVEETHSTLRFASRAKSVENHAVVNEYSDDSDVDTMLKRLKKLEKENSHLKKKISEDASYKTQIQDMESKINSLKSLVINTNNSTTSAADQAPPIRRYTMGALPSQITSKSTSRLMETLDFQSSPNLLLAKKMINRSLAENRRRQAIQYDTSNFRDEGDSVIENSKYKSSFEELSPPCFNRTCTLDYPTSDKNTPDTYGQIYTSTVSLQTDITLSSSVSAATQTYDNIGETLSSQILDLQSHQEYSDYPLLLNSSVSIQTDFNEKYPCKSSPPITHQNSSFQTELLSDFEDCKNVSILIQTSISEEKIDPAICDVDYEVSKSLTQVDFSMQTESQPAFDSHPDTSRASGVDTHVQTENEWHEAISHNVSIQVETDVLDIPSQTSIQTENIHDVIYPTNSTNMKDSSFQTENILSVDSCCSPFPIRETSISVGRDWCSEMGTNTDVIPPLETLDIEIQTESVATPFVLGSEHRSVQTDNPDANTADISVNTSLVADCLSENVSLLPVETQTDTSYLGVDVGIQTDVEPEYNPEFIYIQTLESENKARIQDSIPLESVYVQTCFDDYHNFQEMQVQDSCSAPLIRELTSTQSQTEMEISEILQELSSIPSKSENLQFDIIDHSVETGEMAGHTVQSTDVALYDRKLTNLKSSQLIDCVCCLCSAINCRCSFTYLEQNSYYESTIFDLREKMCEFEVNNEELAITLAAKEEEIERKRSLSSHQDSFKEIIKLLLIGLGGGCDREKYFQSLDLLTDNFESDEMITLLKSLSAKMYSMIENKQIGSIGTIGREQSNADIEAIRYMVSQWSEKELEQLPHYLYSVQTEIQNLNEVINTKESEISELRSMRVDLRENHPPPSSLQSVASQTQLPSGYAQIDEVELVELVQLKNSCEQLEGQLSQSITKNKEYASLLVELQDDSAKLETKNVSSATEQTNLLTLEEVSNLESQLQANNEIMKYLTSARADIVGSFPSSILETYVVHSDLAYYLDQVSQLLKIYTRDLELLEDSYTRLDQLRREIQYCQEASSKNKSEMLNQLEAEKIAHQNAQSNLNSAMEQISDLFKANDSAEQQLKQLELEAEKRTRYFKKETGSFEERLNEANEVYEQNKQLITKLESIESLHSDCIRREKVKEVANQVVKFERDNSSLQKEVENVTAIRSNLEGSILHLKSRMEGDKFDLNLELRKERENSHQQSSRISELEEMLRKRDNAQEIDLSDSMVSLKSEIDELRERVDSQDVTIRERELEVTSTKAVLDEKTKDFDELLGVFRAKNKYIAVLRDVQIPELDDDLTAVTNERDSLQESLSALEAKYKEKSSQLSSLQDVAVSSNSVDKLSMAELRAKCAHNEKQIWNQRRKIDFLEEQCRHIEKRRQLEVSTIPKHDFLSLRADMASLKSQARTEKDAQLYPGFEEPLQPMKNEPKTGDKSTDNCTPQ